ncbi:MAG: pyruvate:ferredoxin (flavodoxin) oxidoreductase [Nanoarchaeota archaeon]|nr:pyruvate:ferredoxin (flavodoxin) oxidoreductase [Nanoarchaeota archaeon]MBU1704015.1 pyruvate:ferredoxin (flavodoxin) oxidoreductase [Nanoarchaeota archaeon]
MEKKFVTIDGNTAATHVAYAFSEVAAIYPITPSSPMGELADEWSAKGMKNLFGETLDVIEMQSEGGASGAVHGALTAGALTTTFTASQGLMLMLPNMFKIAGEMLPTVFHVSARSLACQSLSIFGDHSDVMAVRGTGFAMIAAGSVQEVQDLAIVSHLATLESKIPFLNFFDGFRTSHEVQKVEITDYEVMKSILDMKYVEEFRARALNPEHPVAKVGAQNPDVYFQGRETSNKFYDATPEIVKKYMKIVGDKIGRQYKLFDYIGAKDAESIVISMGSSTEVIDETIEYMNKNGAKVGAIKVRLYRPFSVKDLVSSIPKTVMKIAVLDRTKEPGAVGEPLYEDVVTALKGKDVEIIGGRYGLSSKEFTPSMVKAIFDHLEAGGDHGFTVGINDDVTNLSIDVKEEIITEPEGTIRCKFWGLGSDGTVGANKNSIKIIGDNTDMYAQGYFEYDSKKSGGITRSHLRFGKHPIKSPYLLTQSDFVALHNPAYIGRYDILEGITKGGTFLLNSQWAPEEVFDNLTKDMQETIIKKKIKVYNIDALKIAKEVGLGGRINTVMQAAFFKISGVLPEEEAIKLIKKAIEKDFKRKGEHIVKMNWEAVDKASEGLVEIKVPSKIAKSAEAVKLIKEDADQFAQDIIKPIMHLKGDDIPVSKMPYDGAVPTGTTKLEKRGVAPEVPRWLSEKCIQCGQCAFVCPHAAIRIKQIDPKDMKDAPKTFKTLKSMTKNDKDLLFKVQVYPEDCVGCGVCVEVCPTKEKSLQMKPIQEERDAGENDNEKFFDALPDVTDGAAANTIKGSQLITPLFEFNGACGGCGETPYVKLVTQLFGDRMIIANATGCSSIYGGTFPTIPYCKNEKGQGPAWANSLFEDNAEYGYGMRLAVNSNRKQLLSNIRLLVEKEISAGLRAALKKQIEVWDKVDSEAKDNAHKIKQMLSKEKGNDTVMKKVIELKDYLVDKSVWIFGGDGWAYDIGYGGLDHVLASGKNVNVLVVDTEVYSNTGGQASKSTPFGAVAKFAASGKKSGKKNLGLMMMTYGNIYVASVAMGSNKMQLLKAMIEAESYDGPSIIIAYAPCIAHGIDMGKSQLEEKKAVEAGYWPLYRFDPRLADQGKNPFVWETPEPKGKYQDFLLGETRYKSLASAHPDEAKRLFELAEKDAKRRFDSFKELAER